MRKTCIIDADPNILETHHVETVVNLDCEDFKGRVEALQQRMKQDRLDYVVIYGDREHFANLYFFTGFDPRFEESLLIGGATQEMPFLVVGNECWDYSNISPLPLMRVLYQNFSLQGQPRDQIQPLERIFELAGIRQGSRVGVVGMKYYDACHICDHEHVIDIPAYILHSLEQVTQFPAINYAAALTGFPDGLRMRNSAKQIAIYESAANESSNRLIRMISALKVGVTELEVSAAAQFDGRPLCVYPNINFGQEHVTAGLRSPDGTRLAEGMPVMLCTALRGSLVCRSGLAITEQNLALYREQMETFYQPFFEAVVYWIEHVRIGACAGDIFENVHRIFDTYGIQPALNPGHSIAEDEWTNSMFFRGSQYRLDSGMYLQSDIIAKGGTSGELTGIFEDGYVLADETLRMELAQQYPQVWERICKRRRYIQDVIGLHIGEDLLPMSNTCGVYFPFYLDNTRVFALREV